MEKGNTRKDSAVEPPKSYGALTSVSRKFTVAIAALVIACMCIFWLISNYNTQNLLRQQADTMGITLARQTAALVTELVLANDLISMNVVLSQLTEGSAIVEAAVLNIDGEVIAISTTQTPRQEVDTEGVIRAGDLNHDGLTDFVLWNPRRPDEPIRLLVNRGVLPGTRPSFHSADRGD